MLIVHRYLGFCMSLLFLFWFLSGFVMMYKDFPYLSKTETWERSEEIPVEKIEVMAHEWIKTNGLGALEWASIKVVALEGRPVFRLKDKDGIPYCYYGDTGELVTPITQDRAGRIARAFMGNQFEVTRVEELNGLDQWIPRTRFLPYLPAHKVHMNDGSGTVCYVSSITGEVFQKLNTSDKIWAWLGPIPHWIYFKDLRIHTQRWRNIVIFLSILGTIMCIAGLYMGVTRVRIKDTSWKNLSPYKKFWFKWHHYTGFVFGFIIFAWILSGLLSMNPWRWSPSTGLNAEESALWKGGNLTPKIFQINPAQVLLTQGKESVAIKELEYLRFAGQPYYLLWKSEGTSTLVYADEIEPPLPQLETNLYIQQVKTIQPEKEISAVEVLKDYDAYYYDKHQTKPLPVVKISLKDDRNTSYYINPKTTQVMSKYETKSRINRWLYHGLHSLDFPALYFKRPLWDVIVMILLLGGTSVTLTGLVLTYRWLKRKTKKHMLK